MRLVSPQKTRVSSGNQTMSLGYGRLLATSALQIKNSSQETDIALVKYGNDDTEKHSKT